MTGVIESIRDHRDSNIAGLHQPVDGVSAPPIVAPAEPDVCCSQQPDCACDADDRTRRRSPGKGSIDPATFAARLNRLFDAVRPPGRGPLRNHEVIRDLRARGHVISAPYLSQLRNGRRDQPSPTTLRHLAGVFGISVEYFTTESSAYTRYLDGELYWLRMAHDPQVRAITTALLALSPDARERLLPAADLPADHPRDDRGDYCCQISRAHGTGQDHGTRHDHCP